MRTSTTLSNLQRQYGSYVRGRWQKLRRQFYSYIRYPQAGAGRLIFFGDPLSATVNQQLTNIPKAGSFGTNHFLVKSIHTDFFVANMGLGVYARTDASTIFADLLYGLFSAGVLQFNINARNLLQLPLPFLYAPPANGTSVVTTSGVGGIGAPVFNTPYAVANPPTQAQVQALATDLATVETLLTSQTPHCELARKSTHGRYNLTPSVLIEAEQTFEMSIDYPTGNIPVLATDIVTDNNPLYVGIVLDGIVYRPVG